MVGVGVGELVGGVVGGVVVVPPPVALPPLQLVAPLATVRSAGTLSVLPSEYVTVSAALVMFEAT
nr:hypothetical protein GCM10020092_025270 [Actinoplanes digitatis]